MTASAQGIDISQYQPVYSARQLEAYSFAFFRATVGAAETDANFAANWESGRLAKVHRGAYHELVATATASAAAQAERFITVVRGRGVEAGDLLAVVSSDYAGVTGAEVLAWLQAVKAAFPACGVLVYSNLSMLPSLADCAAFPLWIAWPSGVAPSSVAPWADWTFWQWGETGVDQDAYNGSAAELQAFLDGYAPAPPTADWAFAAPGKLTAAPASVRLSWEAPAGAPEAPAQYRVFAYRGRVCDEGTLVPSFPQPVAGTSFTFEPPASGVYTLHVVAEGAGGAHVKAGVFAAVEVTAG